MFCQLLCFLQASVIELSKFRANDTFISSAFTILEFAEWNVIEWAPTEEEKKKKKKRKVENYKKQHHKHSLQQTESTLPPKFIFYIALMNLFTHLD